MKFSKAFPLVLLSGMIFTGCSGKNATSTTASSIGDLPSASAGAIGGTAAVGAPLSKSTVTIYGNGCEKTGTTNIHGVYTVNMGTCVGPYLIKIVGSLGTVYSLATDADVGAIVNSNPITSLITSLVLGDNDLSNNGGASVSAVTVNDIATKVAIVKIIIQPLLDEFKASSGDILNGTFKANGQGIDRVLDALTVEAGSGADIKVKVKGGTDLTVTPSTNPNEAAAHASTMTAAVANIATAMTDLDLLQGDIEAAVKLIYTRGNISSYCHADYLESGYADCFDYLDESDAEIKVSRPMILEKIAADQYWVAFDIFMKESYDTDYLLEAGGMIMQMKKVGSKWQFYGNQVEYDAEFYPLVMAINSGASSMGYYVQLHDADPSDPDSPRVDVAYNTKPISLKFLAASMVSGADLTIAGTLDGFGQFDATVDNDQACDPTDYSTNYSWHCLKGVKVSGNAFKSQFAKITVSYPTPSEPNTPKEVTFYSPTPKGMVNEIPEVTLTGTNGTVTTECKASISKANWDDVTGLRLDSLDPVWYQSSNFYDLGEDRPDQSTDMGDDEKIFSSALVPVNKTPNFDPDAAFELGYESKFKDIFGRQYIRFISCKQAI